MSNQQTKLNLIYGKSGTGKSEFLYRDINTKIEKFQHIYIIVPEQSNLTSEKKFFEITGRKAMLNVEVLTLSRMACRIADEIGNQAKHLSKVGKSMILYDLLTTHKKDLNFLGKSEKNVEIVDNMITELKKHNISVQALENIELEDTYTNLKIKDIHFLYEKYQQCLKTHLMDENDELADLKNHIKKSKMFENASIYMDEFFGFTPQEYAIFEELIQVCEEMTIAICLNELDTKKSKQSDIFYFNRKFAKKILEIAKKQNCETNLVKLDENHRFKNQELVYLAENLDGQTTKQEEKTKNIELFLANHPYSEVEQIAKKIYDLVKFQGYQYREIGMIANEVENYSEEVKAIFQKYEIPIFIDEKKDLKQNVLIQFILSLLDIFANHWSYEAVFQYLKLDLLEIPYQDICYLENYCKKWGIRGTKWYKKEFNYEPLNEKQEKLENLRKQIVVPLLDFKQSFEQNKTLKELTQNIYAFLVTNKVIANLDKKIKQSNCLEISNEYNTSYQILIGILEEMMALFGEKKVTFEEYKELLMVAIGNSELGKIPVTQDQVILGDIDRTRSHKIKVLFVLGMNDGIFPKNNRQEGYLNDQDRILLEHQGIELAKTSLDAVYENQFHIYRTLTIPEEKLFLSYVSSDKEGKSMRPSIMIKKIKRIFPNITGKSDVITKEYTCTNEKATFGEALGIFEAYLEGNEIPEKWKKLLIYFYRQGDGKFSKAISGMNYTNQTEKISLENIKRMYGSNLKTTISRLENFRKCPFSFHMTYGLKLKENENFQMSTIDTGSFMHEVIDSFFESVDKKGISLREITQEQMKTIVEEIMDVILQTSRYQLFSSSAKFRRMTRRLKKVVLQSMEYILYSLKYSDFKPVGHEVCFGNQGQYEPIALCLDSGEKIEIVGKIDRLDVGRLNHQEYVRIIDYKSQIKRLDLNQVVAGLQIQLLTYLDAITQKQNLEPAGILYLGLIDKIIKAKKNLSEEEIEKEIKKSFKMQGLLLADVNVVKMMDCKLEQGYSDIVPAYIGKDGNLSTKSSVATKEEFEALQKTVRKTIQEISKEILAGNIGIKPYYYQKKTGCEYCKYQAICMFNPKQKGNEYSYIAHRNNQEILKEMLEKGKT